MTTAFVIRTALEVAAILFIVFGIMYEKKLIAFEDRLLSFITKKVHTYKRRKAIEKKREEERTIHSFPGSGKTHHSERAEEVA